MTLTGQEIDAVAVVDPGALFALIALKVQGVPMQRCCIGVPLPRGCRFRRRHIFSGCHASRCSQRSALKTVDIGVHGAPIDTGARACSFTPSPTLGPGVGHPPWQGSRVVEDRRVSCKDVGLVCHVQQELFINPHNAHKVALLLEGQGAMGPFGQNQRIRPQLLELNPSVHTIIKNLRGLMLTHAGNGVSEIEAFEPCSLGALVV